MYKLRKRFTTRDGVVHAADPRPLGIKQDEVREFGPIMPPDKGCATCIFVRLEGGPATNVFFETTGGHHETHAIDPLGWAHTSMYGPGSCYDPEDGETGPWSVQAEGAPSEIVDGIGLPQCHHISTWVVLHWEEGGDTDPGNGGGPDPVEPPPGYVPHIQIAIDGELVYEYGKP